MPTLIVTDEFLDTLDGHAPTLPANPAGYVMPSGALRISPSDGEDGPSVFVAAGMWAAFLEGDLALHEVTPADDAADPEPQATTEPLAEWERDLLGLAPVTETPKPALRKGDLVRLRGDEPSVREFNGLLAEVQEPSGDWIGPLVQPLSERPDGHRRTAFFWDEDKMDRLGALDRTAKPTRGDTVLVKAGATMAPTADNIMHRSESDSAVFSETNAAVATVQVSEDRDGDLYVGVLAVDSPRVDRPVGYVDADAVVRIAA